MDFTSGLFPNPNNVPMLNGPTLTNGSPSVPAPQTTGLSTGGFGNSAGAAPTSGTSFADAAKLGAQEFSSPSQTPSYEKLTYPLPTDSTGQPSVFGGNALNNNSNQLSSSLGSPASSASNPVGPAAPSSTDLSAYLTKPVSTRAGSTATSDSNGSVISPTSFGIDTGGITSSDMQTNNGSTQADVLNQQSQYQQYLNQLAQASQYSPAYLAANSAYQSDVANQAQLANAINTPQGQGLGDTLGQVETSIQRAQTGNAAQEAADAVALQAQTLARSGNIAAAQALVQGTAPVSVSPGSSLVSPYNGQTTYNGLGGLVGVNAIDTYNNYQQYYPGANIPPYNSTLSPSANLQVAQNAVATSPQYKSQYLSTYTTPGGGTGILNKLATAGLQQNPDGTLTLVSGTNAAIGSANESALKTLNTNIQTTQAAFNTVNTQFSNVEQLAQRFGLNQSGVPFLTQLENSAYAQTPGGAGLIAAFKSTIQELRTNLEAVISRGGSVAGAAQDAANLVPDNLSPSQMAQLQAAIQQNGNSAVSALQQQASTVVNNIAAANGQNTQPTSSPYPISNPFSGAAFGN